MGDERLGSFEVIVLDMDDTLYLEREYVRSGFAAVGSVIEDRYGVAGVGADLWRLFLEGVRGDTIDRALALRGVRLSSSQRDALVAAYRSHEPEISLLPDAEALLARCAPDRLGIITDGPEDSQRRKIAALGLERRVKAVVVTAALGEGASKPDPRGYLAASAELGCGDAHHVYVGDNPVKDFGTPRALGWSTVRVRRPLSLHADVPSGDDVDVEVTSLDDIVMAVEDVAPD